MEHTVKQLVHKKKFINELKEIGAVDEAGYFRYNEAFLYLYSSFAGLDPENKEDQREIAVLNQGIRSLPSEMLSWSLNPLLPTNEKISNESAMELAIGLCKSDVIRLWNYEKCGLDFLVRFGQQMSAINAISSKSINQITPEEFEELREVYYSFPLQAYALAMGTNNDTPKVYKEWKGWIKKNEAPELYHLLSIKWDSLEKAYSNIRDLSGNETPDDLDAKRKDFEILAGGTVQNLEELAASAPTGSDKLSLAGKFANLFNFDYSRHGLLNKSDHLIYGIEQNYVDFMSTLSPFVKNRNKVQILDIIGCGKHHNFAGGKKINGGLNKKLLKEWGISEKKILKAAMDIEKAKESLEPFTFLQLDKIIQDRKISEDIVFVLTFGFGLDNSVRNKINILKLLTKSGKLSQNVKNNFKKKTNNDVPDLSIVTTADLRTGKYWYYYTSAKEQPLLSSISFSEIFIKEFVSTEEDNIDRLPQNGDKEKITVPIQGRGTGLNEVVAQKMACTKCGAMILPSTAEKTGDRCMPCFKKLPINRIKKFFVG